MPGAAPVSRLAAAFLLAACAFGQTLQQAESLWKARQYKEAGQVFESLVKTQPKNPDIKVRYGRLLLERFNRGDAATLFQEALEIKKDHAGALLGLALVAADGFEGKAAELAHEALKADPKLLEAQELLARLALEDNNPEKAVEEADKALKLSPNALDAMAIRATIDWMDDKKESPWMAKILAINPKYGEAYATAGYFFVLNRRYEEGIELYKKAIALNPNLWSARSQLGINLMRLGREHDAREQLEIAFNNGQKDDQTTNTLNLMDSYKNFQMFETDNTILRLHKKEAEILRPYFEAELKRAIATYEKKYKIKLDRPVQLEVYPDHEDFAVRTMGMPGLGALGVTFGYVVAMDSPSGRKPGSFHWDSTLWHELSHVFVLSATRHRVPRRFTEGMAVHEETAASPDWGDRLDPNVIRAIKDKKLLPVADLDRGFIHPKYPSQVVVSYFQAGRICDYIKKNWSYDKLLAMMHDYAGGASTPEVIKKELDLAPEEFDKKFLAALEAETKKTVDGFESWTKKIREIAALAKDKKYDDVIREATAIRDVYADYVEAGSAYEFLSDAYLAKGDKVKAAAELARYSEIGGRSPALLKRLATLLEEAGRKKEAAAVLARLNFIYPQDEELHRRLGSLYLDAGKAEEAAFEFRAAVAMKPFDTATARYNLARAYRTAGKTAEAKDELLLALESAPGFRPAQKMLLELSKEETGK
ncbi:MAG TPA: tetratricopeptide repeat protein [Bryobacteraceae bacterium]|nr:tetratricopeptide repeat protein [Bryobacteraceae bacterium]